MRAKYVLSEVMVGLWRNVTMTIAMIITMAVSLTMLGASVLMFLQVDEMKDYYYEQDRGVDLPRPGRSPSAAARRLETALDADPLVGRASSTRPRSRRTRSSRSIYADAPDLVERRQGRTSCPSRSGSS